MKILSVDDVLDAASECDLPSLSVHQKILENALQALANDLANHLGIQAENAAYEGGFGGLCVNFRPVSADQACPAEIGDRDTGGEWE
jgi:hypothetical protein